MGQTRDARLMASILVNDTPRNSQDAPRLTGVQCFLPLGCGRESFRATRRRRVGLDLDEFAKKPAIPPPAHSVRADESGRGREARASFGTARVGYRRLMRP